MSETVVDGLEVVKIKEGDSDCFAIVTTALESVLNAILEESPIGESRQRILQRLSAQFLLQLCSL
jgi:hypothetical protein